jgi:HECT-domain (ubiquitin-transferase)
LQEKWSRSNAAEWECLLRQNFASVVTARDECSREVEEALVFLGRITGTAFRHGIPLDLPFAMNSVWKSLAEESASEDEKLKELDYLAYRLRSSSSERDIQPLLQWQQRMLNSFVEGLGNVLPVEVFPLFTGEELRDTLCGNPEVDVDLLKRVVEYEGYDPDDAVIDYFWQTLREISNDERKQFLQFVWARNRLPIRESDFEAPFKIQKDAVNTGDRADQALPSASTCFSLTLPSYSCQEILKAKLLFAINNVTTMETDFQTNSAEISEGYRALS